MNEGNKLIAEFMSIQNQVCQEGILRFNFGDGLGIEPDEMEYNSSWDWLMPVYMECQERCFKIGSDAELVFTEYFHGVIMFNNIKWVYEAVLSVIEYLNDHN